MVMTLPPLVPRHRRSVSRLSGLCKKKDEEKNFSKGFLWHEITTKDTALSNLLPPQGGT